MSQRVLAHRLGRVPYELAWDLQRRLQHELVAAKKEVGRGGEAPPHRMLLLEHPHVFTLGKNGNQGNLLAHAAMLSDRAATFVQVDRGGDITYHGPGQLVVYPILDLDRIRYSDGRRGTDIHRYLRELEGVVIDLLSEFSISAGRVEGRTGVWLPPTGGRAERKICAFGIRCSRWVTMHGLALNVDPDLSYFDMIVPCGISNAGVTSIRQELGHAVDIAEVASRLQVRFAERFNVYICDEETPPSFQSVLTVESDTAAAA